MSRSLKFIIVVLPLIFSMCKKKTTLEKASELIEKGRYLQAIKEVKKGLLKDSLNANLYIQLCQAYIGADSLLKASNIFLDLYNLDSTKADNEKLKIYLAEFLGLEPYKTTRITRTRSNEFGPYPTSSGVYFASYRGGRSNIYRLTAGKIRRIIKGGGWNSNPVPVSGGLCYSSGFDRAEEIYLYDFKTRRKKRLTNNEEGDYPSAVNGKGDKLLFLSHVDGDWDIYLMDLTTGEQRAVTRNDHLDGDATFTPDEKRIIFVSKIEGAERIVISDLKGKIKEVLPIPEGRHPSFVDSGRIIYQAKGGRDWDLYLYDLKARKRLILTRNKREDYRPRTDFRNKRVYFVRKIRRQWDIHMIDLNLPIETERLIEEIKMLTGREKEVS